MCVVLPQRVWLSARPLHSHSFISSINKCFYCIQRPETIFYYRLFYRPRGADDIWTVRIVHPRFTLVCDQCCNIRRNPGGNKVESCSCTYLWGSLEVRSKRGLLQFYLPLRCTLQPLSVISCPPFKTDDLNSEGYWWSDDVGPGGKINLPLAMTKVYFTNK